MGAGGSRLQLIPYIYCTVLRRCLAFALFPALFFEAALGLFEERGEDSSQRDDERDEEENDAGDTPQGGVSGRAGLLRDVGVGEAAGDEREESQCGGEDVEVASHGVFLFYGEIPHGPAAIRRSLGEMPDFVV